MEAFCSEHNLTIDEVLYDWPHTRFEAFYDAYARRKIADELSRNRAMEIAALWSNTNLDSEKQPEIRQKWMESIDERYSTVIASLYGMATAEEKAEIDPDDPFWQAMERGLEKKKLPQTGE